METVTPSDYPTLRQPLLQLGLLQKVVVIAPAIKGRISTVTRESQRADHAIIETRMTHTVNESSPGVYRWEMNKKEER